MSLKESFIELCRDYISFADDVENEVHVCDFSWYDEVINCIIDKLKVIDEFQDEVLMSDMVEWIIRKIDLSINSNDDEDVEDEEDSDEKEDKEDSGGGLEYLNSIDIKYLITGIKYNTDIIDDIDNDNIKNNIYKLLIKELQKPNSIHVKSITELYEEIKDKDDDSKSLKLLGKEVNRKKS